MWHFHMDGGGWRRVLGSRSGIFTWWPLPCMVDNAIVNSTMVWQNFPLVWYGMVLGSRSGIFTGWPAGDSGHGTRQFTSDLALPQSFLLSFVLFGQGFYIHAFPPVAVGTILIVYAFSSKFSLPVPFHKYHISQVALGEWFEGTGAVAFSHGGSQQASPHPGSCCLFFCSIWKGFHIHDFHLVATKFFLSFPFHNITFPKLLRASFEGTGAVAFSHGGSQ